MRFVTYVAAYQGKRHLVTKQTIVIRDPGNALNHMTAFRAPLMNHFELEAHEPAVAIVGQSAYQLRTSHTKLDSLVCPGLGDQVHGGYDPARGNLFDNSEIVWVHSRVRTREQVVSPGGDALGIRFVLTVDLAIKFCQGVCVFACRTTHDQ